MNKKTQIPTEKILKNIPKFAKENKFEMIKYKGVRIKSIKLKYFMSAFYLLKTINLLMKFLMASI